MIKISKREKNYLVENGCKWGEEIFKTYSGHPTYYACEKQRVFKLLDKYKNEVTIESHVCM